MKRKITLLAMILAPFFCNATSFYWVGGSGNWSDFGHHWATSSGGAIFQTQVPQSTDNVYFDALSFAPAMQTVTVDQPIVQCADMNWTGALFNPTFFGDSTSTLKIYGSLTLFTTMTFNLHGQVSMEGITAGNSINSFGTIINASLAFNGVGGSWLLQGALGVTNAIYLNNGTLNTNNQEVHSAAFYSSTNNSNRALIMGSSNFSLSGNNGVLWNINPAGMMLNAGTSTIYGTCVGSGGSFYGGGGGLTYNNVNFTGNAPGFLHGNNTFHDVSFAAAATINENNTFNNVTLLGNGTINSSNVFNNLTFSPGHTYTLQTIAIQTVGNICAQGTSVQPIIIQSSTSLSAYISKASGNVCWDYVHVSNIAAIGGAIFNAGLAPTNSQDLGGNSGLLFTGGCTFVSCTSTPPPPPCALIVTAITFGSTVTVTASGGTNPYRGMGTFTGVAPGTYTYTVTDTNGCSGSATVTVSLGISNNCTNAVPIPIMATCLYNQTLGVGETERWFSFTADSANMLIQLHKNPASLGHIHTLAFYTGTCSTLHLVDSVNATPTNDTLFALNESNLTVGNIYYFKAARKDSTCSLCTNFIVEYDVCVKGGHGTSPCMAPVITNQPVPSNVCAGNMAMFFIATTFASSYQWQVNQGAGFTNISNTPPYNGVTMPILNIVGVTTPMNGYQYRCIVSNGTCSSTSNAAMLTINQALTVTVNSPTICLGQSVTLTASGAAHYFWPSGVPPIPPAPPVSGDTTASITVSPLTTTTYTVTGTTNGCSSTAIAMVTVGTPPSITASTDSTTVIVFATGGTPPYTGTGTFTGLASGTYSYTATDSIGCTASTTIIVTEPASKCAIAKTFANTNSSIGNNTLIGTEMWFTFTADSASQRIEIRKDPASLGHIHTLAFYSGICSSLNLLDSVNVTPTNDTLLTLNENNLTTGSVYHVKASRSVMTCGLCTNNAAKFAMGLIHPPPPAPACVVIVTPPSQTICLGETATITASGATGYVWSTTATTATIYDTPTAAGTYTYTVTGTTGGCSNTAVATVTVTNNTPISITQYPVSVSVCPGGNATFTVGATGTGLTYQWYVSFDGGSTFSPLTAGSQYNVVNSPTLSITPVPSGLNLYVYQCLISGVCLPSVSVYGMLSGPTYVLGIPYNQTPCIGDPANFNVNALGVNLTYQWQVDDGSGFTNIPIGSPYYIGETTAYLNISNTTGMSGYQYRCIVFGDCAPSSQTSNIVTLTTYQAPMVNAIPPFSICSGQTAILTATGTATQYSWDGSNGSYGNGSTFSDNPTTMTTYTVYGSVAGTQCERNATTSVTVNPLPTATIDIGGSTSVSVCQNASSPNITFTGGGGTAPYTFTYTINGGSNQTISTIGLNNSVALSAPTATTGTFTYSLVSVQESSSTTCSQSQSGSATITVNPLPTATIIGTTSVCEGTASPNITFTGANGTAPYTFTYSINGGANQTISTTGGNSVTLPVSTAIAGTFIYSLVSVQESSSTTCSQSQSGNVTVTVNPLPIMNSANSATICNGGTVSISLTSGIASTYTWIAIDNLNTNGESTTLQTGSPLNNTITNNSTSDQTVTYTVTPTSNPPAGCTGTLQTVSVIVHPTPAMTSTNIATICSGGTVSIPLTSNIPCTYIWKATNNPNTTGESLTNQTTNTLSNTIINNTTTAQTVTYTVTPTSTGTAVCPGTPQIVTVTVNPKPAMTSATTATICSGTALNIHLASNVASTYTWIAANNANTIGESTTLQASSTLNDVITNNSTVNQTVTYTVTPTSNSPALCPGTPQTVIVTVHPAPTMTSANSATICNGTTVNIPLTSNIASSKTWIATDNINTTGESTTLQTGGPLHNTITNNSTSDQTVTYTVTPTSPPPASCPGTPQTVIVTVHPTITMTSANSATICSGGTVSIPLTSNIPCNYIWKATNNPNTTGESLTNQTTSTLSNTIINNTATVQTVTYTVTPTSTGSAVCPGTSQIVTVIVNPKPIMTSAAAATICSGTALNIHLASNVASTYTWIAANNVNTTGESTVLQSSGTINDVIINTTPNNQTVTYTVTPTSNSPASCPGTPQTVIVTVHPAPTMTSTNNATICNGATVNIPLISNIASTKTWIATDNPFTTGESTTLQTGSPLHNTITNNSTSDQTVTYTVTPTSNPPASCPGTPQTVIVTVHPTITMSSANSATICSGATVSIPLTSNISCTYIWKASNNIHTTGESLTNQTTSILSNTIYNNSTTVQTVTYTVTPTSTTGNCQGAPQTITVTVNPVPSAYATPSAQTFCTGGTTNINLSSLVSGTTFSWTVVSTNVSGASAGSGSIIAQSLSTAIGGSVVYTITPATNFCTGDPITVTIIVNPVQCTGGLPYIDKYVPCMGNLTSQVFGIGTTTVTGLNISVSTVLTVDAPITFNACNFVMAPGASIVMTANLTIGNKTHIYSCGDMWDGIYVNPVNSNLPTLLTIKDNAFIEDAKNAIVVPPGTGTATFNISDAIFNRNLTAVDVNSGSSSDKFEHSIVTSRDISYSPNTSFNPTVASLLGNLATLTMVHLKAPYSDRSGLYGINATGNAVGSTIQIGKDALGYTNTFDAIMCGINLTNSNATIYNNNFQYLLLGTPLYYLCPPVSHAGGSPPPPCLFQQGIGIQATGSFNSNYSISIGGSANSYQTNSFFNTYAAINVNYYYTNNIINNSINNGSTFTPPPVTTSTGYGEQGIYVKPSGSGNTIDVVGNTVNNCDAGIWVYNDVHGMDSKWCFIDHNTVTADASGHCNNGITIQDVTNTPTLGTLLNIDKNKIQFNTVHQVNNCITATNIYGGLAIRGNDIQVRNNGTSGNGIRLQKCYKAKVHENTNITSSPWTNNINYKGIYVTTSPYSQITCNNITGMGEHMTFMGSCIKSTLRDNTMTAGNRGLVLRNNGEIGVQGGSKSPCDLWWSTNPNTSVFTAQTYTDNTTNANTNSQLFVNNKSVPAFYIGVPNVNSGINPLYFYSSISGGLNNANPLFGPFDCSTIIISSYQGHAPHHSGSSLDTTQLTALAFDTAQYPVYELENRYQHKLYAFNQLDSTGGSGAGSALQNFYDSAQIATLGQLKAVDSALANKNYTEADAINSGIVSSNLMEANQQQFNTLYLLSLIDTAYKYSQANQDAIFSIATQCPLEGGNAVWQARALFCGIENSLIEFDDNCIVGSKRMMTINNKETSTNFILFPNPNDGTMQLAYILNTNETGIFELYDISGKHIVNYILDSSSTKLNIDNLQLNNGIYYYNVRVNEKIIKTEKIVIIK